MFEFIKELAKIDVEYSKLSDNKTVEDFPPQKTIFKFKSYVKRVEPRYILIDFLFYKGVEYNIPMGNRITVKFKETGGLYLGYCNIIGRDNSHLPGIKISYPTDIKFIQQRDYVRAPIKLNAELVIFPEKEDEDIKVEPITTLDISGSGFCFVSDKPFERHSKIIGVFNLSNPEEKPIEILLKHIYSRTFYAVGKERYKNAFTFEDLEEESREKIVREVFLYELESRKKQL